MKLKIYFVFLFTYLSFHSATSQTCNSSFIYSYTGITNLVWFQDKSTAPTNWQRDYTNWNFNDGSAIQINPTTTHTFPLPQIYNVVKETKFSEIGNPNNFCIAKDSLLINAALSTSTNVCVPHVAMKAKWLTGLTYGVSNFVSNGCPYNYREITADTGSIFMGNPMAPNVLFTTNQYYFTYTIPLPQYSNSITHHINYPDPNNFNGVGDYFYSLILTQYQTPTDCHASFFLTPSDSTLHNWTIQDFSSSSDSLSYFWDFGDNSSSTLASPSHTYSSVGMYTICLTVSSGTCSDTYCETAFVDTTINGSGILSVNVQKMMITGLAKKTKKQTLISIFPNPAKDELNISYPFKNENYIIQITNTLGQTIINKTMEDLSNNNLNLNIEELNNGVFFIQIKSSSGESLSKARFIKQ